MNILAGPILEHESKSARSAYPWDRRRRETQSESVGKLRELAVHVLQNLLILLLRLLAFAPVLQGDEEESAVAGSHEAE